MPKLNVFEAYIGTQPDSAESNATQPSWATSPRPAPEWVGSRVHLFNPYPTPHHTRLIAIYTHPFVTDSLALSNANWGIFLNGAVYYHQQPWLRMVQATSYLFSHARVNKIISATWINKNYDRFSFTAPIQSYDLWRRISREGMHQYFECFLLQLGTIKCIIHWYVCISISQKQHWTFTTMTGTNYSTQL